MGQIHPARARAFPLHQQHEASNNLRERNEQRDSTEISFKEIHNLPLILYFRNIRYWNIAVAFFETLLSLRVGCTLDLPPTTPQWGESQKARSNLAASFLEKH